MWRLQSHDVFYSAAFAEGCEVCAFIERGRERWREGGRERDGDREGERGRERDGRREME